MINTSVTPSGYLGGTNDPCNEAFKYFLAWDYQKKKNLSATRVKITDVKIHISDFLNIYNCRYCDKQYYVSFFLKCELSFKQLSIIYNQILTLPKKVI